MEKNFLIINVSEISLINFSEILEDSVDTLRISVDGTKTFIKWVNEQPSFVTSLQTAEGPYTIDEILTILNTSEWTTIEQ